MKLSLELNKKETSILRALKECDTPMYPDEIARMIYPMKISIYQEISIL